MAAQHRARHWNLDVALLAVIVLSVAVTTWWLVGDLSETSFRTPQGPVSSCEELEQTADRSCDHLLRPPPLDPGAEKAVGASATVVALTSGAAFVVRLRGRTHPRTTWLVPIELLAAAVLTGWGHRILTLGASGANIGGGLFVLSGVPIILALVIIACWQLWRSPRAPSSS